MNAGIIATAILSSAVPCIAGTTVPSLTRPTPVASHESGWHYRAGFYTWATALEGDVAIRGRGIPVDSGFDDILENLEFAVMGVMEVGCGKWSFLADLFYAELSTSNTSERIHAAAELNQFLGNFAVVYNVLDTECTRFDVFAGTRVSSLDADVEIDFQQAPDVSESSRKSWVDPIIGIRFQQEISEQFFFRAVADFGSFGISSDITWQALAGVGYRVSDKGSMLLAYRGIGTDYSSGDFAYDVVSHGLLLGYEYTF